MKTFLISLFLIIGLPLSAQNKDIYTFSSGPSFHNGFSITVNRKSNLVQLKTQNNYLYLDTLKADYRDLPHLYSDNETLEKNPQLLSNSVFDKLSSSENTEKLIQNIEAMLKRCVYVSPEKYNFDGIFFSVSYNNKNCKIQSPSESEENGKNVLEILKIIKNIFQPNSFVNKYIFDSEMYIIDNKSFEIVSTKPLFIKIYRMPWIGCENFKSQIENLPEAEEVFIDITEFENPDKSCVINSFGEKYKNIKIIQIKEIDSFNTL